MNKLKGFADGIQNVCSSSDGNYVTNNKFPPFTPLSPEEKKLIAEHSEGISNIFSGHMSTANNTAVTGMILMSTGDMEVVSNTLADEVKNPITTVSKPDPVHKLMNETLNNIYNLHHRHLVFKDIIYYLDFILFYITFLQVSTFLNLKSCCR